MNFGEIFQGTEGEGVNLNWQIIKGGNYRTLTSNEEDYKKY